MIFLKINLFQENNGTGRIFKSVQSLNGEFMSEIVYRYLSLELILYFFITRVDPIPVRIRIHNTG